MVKETWSWPNRVTPMRTNLKRDPIAADGLVQVYTRLSELFPAVPRGARDSAEVLLPLDVARTLFEHSKKITLQDPTFSFEIIRDRHPTGWCVLEVGGSVAGVDAWCALAESVGAEHVIPFH